MDYLNERQIGDLAVLVTFVRVYCRSRHRGSNQSPVDLPSEMASRFRDGVSLCEECAALVRHSIDKRKKCPLDPKPSCKHCHIHCYSKEHRVRIREIMAFSGRRMILRGRLDYLWHYFF